MPVGSGPQTAAATTSETTPTRTIHVDGTPFGYRELGPRTGVPLVFLHHFTAVLDDWDPRVIDGIGAKRHVIAFDNHWIGECGRPVAAAPLMVATQRRTALLGSVRY